MADEWGPWHAHNGGECPVEPARIVQVCTVDMGAEEPDRADRFGWSHCGADIVAYRVKRQPVVETVRKPACVARHRQTDGWVKVGCHIAAPDVDFTDIRLGFEIYETRDGIPDMTTLRWEDTE